MNEPRPELAPASDTSDTDRARVVLRGIFPQLEPEIIERLLENAAVRHYPEQTRLCHEGEIENTFYVLLDGQADIYRHPEGDPILVDYLRAGQCFGELALILDTPRSGDVIVSEAVTVLEIAREAFDRISAEHPEVLRTVTRLVIERMLKQEEHRLIQLSRQQKERLSRPRIFVSYSRHDYPFVARLAAHLKEHHFNVWLDVFEMQAGKSWARQIGEALDSSRLMLLVLSPDSLESGNVEDEWNYFLDKKKPIVPILYRPCEIPYRLFKLQYVDFTSLSYGSALAQLIANLNTYHLEL